MKYSEQVFRITDLVKMIDDWKRQFELISDIEKLNKSFDFQHILFHIFHNLFDTEIILRDNTERLKIVICFCETPFVEVIFRVYEKYKKVPYYFDNIIFNRNSVKDKPLTIQNSLSHFILNDYMILAFLR